MAALREQISLAMDLEQEKETALLQARWAHRFGLDNIPLKSSGSNNDKKGVTSSVDEFSLERLGDHKENNDIDCSLEEIDGQFSEKILFSKNDSNDENLNVNNLLTKSSIDYHDSSNVSPPLPSLNSLRRWIPRRDSKEDLPKAS